MKKYLILTLFGVFCTSLSAQFLLGGQFNFNIIKDKTEYGNFTEEYSTNIITVLPRLAFAQKNLWFGADAGVSMLVFKEDDGQSEFKTTMTTGSVAPFVRYVKQPTDYFGIWIEGQGGVSFGKGKDNDGEVFAKYSGFNIGIRPGVIFYIGNHLSFEASFGRLGVNSLTTKDPDNDDAKDTVTQAGLILNNNDILLNLNLDNYSFYSISSGFQFGVNWLF